MINFNPKVIEKIDDLQLRVTWDDGHVSTFSFQFLRRNCPCALCRDESTGDPKLDPQTISATITAKEAELVGQYALRFDFSDGHGAGIFQFESLRELCPCKECSYHEGSETN